MREEGFWSRPATGGVVSGTAAMLDEFGPPAFVWPGTLAGSLAELNDLELTTWQQHKIMWPPPGVVEGVWVDEVTHYFEPATPEPAPEVTLADVVRAYRQFDVAPRLPDKIKLTSAEWDAARRLLPKSSRPLDGAFDLLASTPVELVDDPEESDLRRWGS